MASLLAKESETAKLQAVPKSRVKRALTVPQSANKRLKENPTLKVCDADLTDGVEDDNGKTMRKFLEDLITKNKEDFHPNAQSFSVTAGCHSNNATTALKSSSAADVSITAESHGNATSAFKSLSEQHSDTGVQNEDHHSEEDKIQVQVALLGGGACIVDTFLSAKVRDLKDAIQLKLGHSPYSQKLVLAETVLADSDATLADVGVADATVLTLILSREPIGQSKLDTANGKKHFSLSDGSSLSECLNEFELMSWEAAFEAGAETWDDEERPNLGPWGLDLYWTTRSDGCRYEYWSSAPGDNEYGIFVRVDANEMSAIALGNDDGIDEFKDFVEETPDYDTFTQLTKEGWPRPECWAEDSDEEE